MFAPDTFIVRQVEGGRYVRKVIAQSLHATHYLVTEPLFVCWGSTFKRWSKPHYVTRAYIDRHFKVLPDNIAQRYRDIKPEQSTDILFQTGDVV